MRTVSLFVAMLLSASIASGHAARKVHVLFLIDSKADQVGDDIGPACSNNASALKSLMEKALEPGQLNIQTVSGEDMNPENIKRKIASFRDESKPDESIFVYYCGHGVVREGNQHIFATAGGEISRQEVVNEMNGFPSRLKILITDTCTSFDGPQFAPAQDYSQETIEPKMFQDLFLRARGFVDFTAASFGEFAWSSGGNGGRGFFSSALERSLMKSTQYMDSNMDSIVAWEEIFSDVYRGTNENFLFRQKNAAAGDKIKDSQGQHPSYWSLGFDSDLLRTTYKRHFWASSDRLYEMQVPGIWNERNYNNEFLATLEQVDQDKDFLYLKDTAGNRKLALGKTQIFSKPLDGDDQSQWNPINEGKWIQTPGRNRAEWFHANGRFVLGEDGWQELDENGTLRNRYKRVGTQNGSVTLYNAEADFYVKLTPDGASMRQGESGEFQTLYPGSWPTATQGAWADP